MPEPPLISNKWKIIRTIGHGAMGSVYEVEHKTIRTRRAIKQLNPRFHDTPEIAKRFMKEAQRVAALSQDEKEDHHIVRVYDFDDSDSSFGPYLVMELVDGEDLKHSMGANHRLAFGELCRIGAEIAVALQYAHEHGLIHRDIKPANILIEHGSGRAVVTDFGIAKQIESEAEESMTGTREFLGTVRYSSPEQIRNERSEPVDQRADIYSLGVVLYEVSSGRQFLEGMTPSEIMHRVGFDEKWEAPLTFPRDILPEFTQLVRACLQRHRDHRIPRAAIVVERLRQCAAANETLRNKLRGQIEQGAAALRERWTKLADEGGALVAPDAGQQFARLALQIDTHARDDNWAAARAAIDEAQRFLDGVTSDVRQNAAAAVEERLAAMTQAAAEFAALTGSAQVEDELRRLRATVTADLEGGHFHTAKARLDTAWRTLTRTLEEQRQAVRQRLESARAHVTELRRSLDPQDRSMACEAFARAREAIRRAEDAESNGELRTAELQYEAAAADLETCRAEREQTAGARARVETRRNGIDRGVAGSVAQPELEAADARYASAQEAEQRGEYARARDAFEAAERSYEAVESAVAKHPQALVNQVRQLQPLATAAEDPDGSRTLVAPEDARAALEPNRGEVSLPVPNGKPLRKVGALLGAVALVAGVAVFLLHARPNVPSSSGESGKPSPVVESEGAMGPLVFDFSPKQLRQMQFDATQEFELIRSPGLASADVSYAWQLDGNTVANTPKFLLKATDPQFVREAPWKLAAMAKDALGRTFSHEWEFSVMPTAPRIVANAPSDRNVVADGGSPLAFTLTASEPVGSQKLAYVFQVDGKEAQRGDRSRFEYRASDDASHEVVAYVQDTFGQISAQRVSWKLSTPSIEPKVRAWLQEFENARRNKDADKEGLLRNLSADEVLRLKAFYRIQGQIKVRVGATRIERTSGNRAAAIVDIEDSVGNMLMSKSRCRFTFEMARDKLNYLTGPCELVK